jgi:hypothetical protein
MVAIFLVFYYTVVMFHELNDCKVIFIIRTIYTLIFILKTSSVGLYLLVCPRAFQIIELSLMIGMTLYRHLKGQGFPFILKQYISAAATDTGSSNPLCPPPPPWEGAGASSWPGEHSQSVLPPVKDGRLYWTPSNRCCQW